LRDTDLIEDDDPHDLALDDDDPALVVDADAARVLKDVGTELSHELPVLVVQLDLSNVEWGKSRKVFVEGEPRLLQLKSSSSKMETIKQWPVL